jgi:hypothetical protein
MGRVILDVLFDSGEIQAIPLFALTEVYNHIYGLRTQA